MSDQHGHQPNSARADIKRQPLPVSNEIPLGSPSHLHMHHSRSFQSCYPYTYVGNKNSLNVASNQSGYSLDKIEEKIGSGHIILGAKFVLHSCVTYPFIVFSRQCQANPYYNISRVYTAPLKTLYVMKNITSSQGFKSWWRGFKPHVICVLGRPFAAAALTWTAERWSRNNRLSSFFNWIRSNIIHLVINGLSYAICLPLVSFVLMECVQHTHQKTYSHDYGGFRELTLERPFFISSNSTHHMSFLHLLVPTIATNIFHDLLTEQILKIVSLCPPIRSKKLNSSHLSLWSLHRKLWASFVTSFIVDVLLYPLRTVVLRLHLQGLPILVENVEFGTGVQYVTTFYNGPIDCLQGIWEAEGIFGFYKGLSSVLLQHLCYGLLLIIIWRGMVEWSKLKQTKY